LEPALRGTGKIIFVCSMGDLFHQDVPESFIREILKLVTATGQHTFLMLTKRPERMRNVFKSYYATGAAIIRNLWLGVTAENQKTADERIPILLQIPAAVRFVSCEPLLGPIDLSAFKPFDGECFCQDDPKGCKPRLTPNCPVTAIDWVICGGETGPNARPMHLDWVRSLRDQCREAEVPFFFKQWGEWQLVNLMEPLDVRNKETGDFETWPAGKEVFKRVGRKAAGRLLDGRTWNEMPNTEVSK
jgi:protein gp37